MRRKSILIHLGILLAIGISTVFSQTTKDTLFPRSLHYTARGMSYWYDASNGGLESITGVPYSKLGCQNCHVSECSRCHLSSKDGVPVYSTASAGKQEMCLECHAREASILKIDAEANQKDIHVAKGMKCMDCHSVREIHGDGIAYVSMKQKGAMDTNCERCHTPEQSRAHTIHGEKVDCKACHDRHVVSCTNCHFETMVQEGKRISIPVSGWLFLMNLDGKVTTATMQSFVAKGKKTFLMFAPQHSHSIMQKGRDCSECHGSQVLQNIEDGIVALTWLRNGKLENLKGVIPVAEGTTWQMVYQDRADGQWIVLKDPLKPKLHYVGFGGPLTAAQIQSLRKPQADMEK